MSTHKKLISLGAAAVLALGLAACGGGGGPAPVAPQPKPVDLTGVTPGYGALTAGETELDADGTTTNGNVTFTCASDAGADGCTVIVADGNKVTYTGGMVTAANSAAYNTALDKAKNDRIAMAKSLGSALTATPTSTFDPAAETTSVDGGVVSTSDGTVNNYAKSDDDMPPSAGTDWTGSVWTQENTTAKTMDTLVVYTNKQAAKSAEYTTYYAKNADSTPTTGGAAGFSWVAWAGVTGVSNDDKGILSLSTDEQNATDTSRLYSADSLPGKGVMITYPDGDDSADDIQVEFDGMFDGVAGKYKCTSDSACTASMSLSGQMTLAGTWTFVPTSTDVMVAGVQTDNDYLDLGYWVQKNSSGTTPSYKIEAFQRGSDKHESINAVAGRATYSGKAAGMFARQVLATDGTVTDASSGRFTADAMLNAAFGGGAVPEDDHFSISGTISNFMDSAGMAIDSSWSVTLNEIRNAVEGQGVTNEGVISGGTTAAGGAAGVWSGQYYGAEEPVQDATPQPTAVAGEFTAGFTNGSVVGAFGATKQ